MRQHVIILQKRVSWGKSPAIYVIHIPFFRGDVFESTPVVNYLFCRQNFSKLRKKTQSLKIQISEIFNFLVAEFFCTENVNQVLKLNLMNVRTIVWQNVNRTEKSELFQMTLVLESTRHVFPGPLEDAIIFGLIYRPLQCACVLFCDRQENTLSGRKDYFYSLKGVVSLAP